MAHKLCLERLAKQFRDAYGLDMEVDGAALGDLAVLVFSRNGIRQFALRVESVSNQFHRCGEDGCQCVGS